MYRMVIGRSLGPSFRDVVVRFHDPCVRVVRYRSPCLEGDGEIQRPMCRGGGVVVIFQGSCGG